MLSGGDPRANDQSHDHGPPSATHSQTDIDQRFRKNLWSSTAPHARHDSRKLVIL
jgi:hypothetical protein